MGYSDLDPAVHERRPWNVGQNVGPKRPLKPRDIWAIRFSPSPLGLTCRNGDGHFHDRQRIFGHAADADGHP